MKLREATGQDRVDVQTAIVYLQRARDLLIAAGVKRTVVRVRRAIKSAEGALRHVERAMPGPLPSPSPIHRDAGDFYDDPTIVEKGD